MKKGFTILELLIIVSAVGILAFMSVPKLSDVKDSGRAAEVQKNLADLRVALEEYYSQTGEYPVLSGAEDNLREVKTEGKSGESVNFGEVLERRDIPSTPELEGISGGNTVTDLQDFSKSTHDGGWNYNFTERTGEIHANLPENIFKQSIDWSRQ